MKGTDIQLIQMNFTIKDITEAIIRSAKDSYRNKNLFAPEDSIISRDEIIVKYDETIFKDCAYLAINMSDRPSDPLLFGGWLRALTDETVAEYRSSQYYRRSKVRLFEELKNSLSGGLYEKIDAVNQVVRDMYFNVDLSFNITNELEDIVASLPASTGKGLKTKLEKLARDSRVLYTRINTIQVPQFIKK
jgi:hypothetical protein